MQKQVMYIFTSLIDFMIISMVINIPCILSLKYTKGTIYMEQLQKYKLVNFDCFDFNGFLFQIKKIMNHVMIEKYFS